MLHTCMPYVHCLLINGIQSGEWVPGTTPYQFPLFHKISQIFHLMTQEHRKGVFRELKSKTFAGGACMALNPSRTLVRQTPND